MTESPDRRSPALPATRPATHAAAPGRMLLTALRTMLFAITGLALLDALLVTASLFITDRAPSMKGVLLVSIGISAVFVLIAGLAFGIQHQMGRLARAGAVMSVTDPALDRSFRALAGVLLASSLLFGIFLLLLSYAILARIDQGFAVFG